MSAEGEDETGLELAEDEVVNEEPVEEEALEEAAEEPVEEPVEEAAEEDAVEETKQAAAEQAKNKKDSKEVKNGEKLTGAAIFKELKKVIPTIDEEDYKKNGVWQDEVMKLDAELLQRHLEEAGAPRVETNLPLYKAPPQEVWDNLSKPSFGGNLAGALARAAVLAQTGPKLGLGAAGGPKAGATSLLSKLQTAAPGPGLVGARPTLRIPVASSTAASSGASPALKIPVMSAGLRGPQPLSVAGVKRTASIAGLPMVQGGKGARPMLGAALGGRPMGAMAGARPMGSVTGLAQKLNTWPPAAGKGLAPRPAMGIRPMLQRR